MPNVIVIASDEKIKSQIISYLHEIDETNFHIRFFTSHLEFEKKYFTKKIKVKEHPLHKIKGLEKFSFEELEEARVLSLSTKSVLPHPQQIFKLHLRTRKIETIQPVLESHETAFHQFPEDLQNQPDFFLSLQVPAFKKYWDNFFACSLKETSHITLPMKSTDKDYGWFQLTGQFVNPDYLSFTVQDVTPEIKNILDQEKQNLLNQTEEPPELQILSQIDLIIFKLDDVHEKIKPWLDKTWSKLKEGQYFPTDHSPRFVLLKFEDDGTHKLDLLHQRLDDIIYLPFDRLIFLQKIEIILALPKKATPSFLFTQEVKMDVEISKISILEKISEFGLAIRNPVRLVPNLIAHFYLTLPSESQPLDFWGKVLHSEPHPERPTEFLIYFSYFGISKNCLLSIRQYLRKFEQFHSFLNTDRSQFSFTYTSALPSSPQPQKKLGSIVILNLEETMAHNIENSLSHDMDQVQIVTETSYAAFINRFFNPQLKSPDFNFSPATITDLWSPSVCFTIQSSTLDFINMDLSKMKSSYDESSTYFGHSAKDCFSHAKGWQTPFYAHSENQEILNEMILLAKNGRKMNRMVSVLTAQGEGRLVRILVQFETSQEVANITISLPNSEDIGLKTRHKKINNFNIIILDLGFLASGGLEGFLEALHERVHQSGLLKSDQRLKFILTVEDEKQLDCRALNHPDVIGIFAQPLELKSLSFLVAQALENQFSIYKFSNLGWHRALLPIHVAKNVHLNSLSEFGAQIQSTRPIAPGTVLFLRGFIFDQAPNRCLAGRFYHCEEDSQEKGQFSCSLTYFGINDTFLKYARKMFRETYAQSKQTE